MAVTTQLAHFRRALVQAGNLTLLYKKMANESEKVCKTQEKCEKLL
jgi:hypothetical protein